MRNSYKNRWLWMEYLMNIKKLSTSSFFNDLGQPVAKTDIGCFKCLFPWHFNDFSYYIFLFIYSGSIWGCNICHVAHSGKGGQEPITHEGEGHIPNSVLGWCISGAGWSGICWMQGWGWKCMCGLKRCFIDYKPREKEEYKRKKEIKKAKTKKELQK